MSQGKGKKDEKEGSSISLQEDKASNGNVNGNGNKHEMNKSSDSTSTLDSATPFSVSSESSFLVPVKLHSNHRQHLVAVVAGSQHFPFTATFCNI